MTTKMTGAVRKDGGWTLIGTQEASNDASLTQTGLNSTYDLFCVIISSYIPVNDAQAIMLQFGDSSGIDSGGSDYEALLHILAEGSTTYSCQDNSSLSAIQVTVGTGTNAGEGVSCMFWIMNPGDAGTKNTFFGTYSQYSDDPKLRGGTTLGLRSSAIVLDRILIKAGSGNIESCRMSVWGLPHE